MTYTCKICSFQTENKSSYAGHISGNHSNYIKIIPKCCSLLTRRECGIYNLDQHEAAYLKHLKHCPTCDNEFSSSNKFCSKTCSAVFTNKKRPPMSQETKDKISKSVKANPSGWALNSHLTGSAHPSYIPRKTAICHECNQIFQQESRENKKYCSRQCTLKNAGGYRPNSGRGKSGHYKGFYLSSTYELAYVIYCLDHGIKIKRCDQTFEYINSSTNKKHTYHPDFVIGGVIIEIKGYKTQLNIDKANAVSVPYKILYKDDLKEIFDYVENKTNLKIEQLYTLYDNHKPKYNYTCTCCNIKFSTESKRKTKNVFCGRVCSMKHNKTLSNSYANNNNFSKYASISKEDALIIFNSTMTYSTLAQMYNTSKAMVCRIKQTRSYKWIHD